MAERHSTRGALLLQPDRGAPGGDGARTARGGGDPAGQTVGGQSSATRMAPTVFQALSRGGGVSRSPLTKKNCGAFHDGTRAYENSAAPGFRAQRR